MVGFWGGGDVGEHAFADFHEVSISPMRADGEEGNVFFAVVEDVAFACLGEGCCWGSETLTHNPH